MPSRFAQAMWETKSRLAQADLRRVEEELRASERLDPEELRATRAATVMEVALHAFDTTDFYREHYESAGLEREDLKHVRNLSALPLVEKRDVREHAPRMTSRAGPAKDRLPSSTGGSTGEPLLVFHDRRSPVAPMWWRPYRWWGLSPADNVANIIRQRRTRMQQIRHRLEWWPTRELLLNPVGMTVEDMAAFLDRWTRVRPRLLNGYGEAVDEFAKFVATLEEGMPSPPKAVAVTATRLSPPQRAFIESTLGAPVYDCYRSAEVPWIAAQCEVREGLHAMADLRWVEIVRESDLQVQDAGEEGEVVVTDLTNRVFPLVRYRMGDRSRLRHDACPCGRTLPLMDAVDGRVTDVLRSPGGQFFTALSPLFNRWPGVVRKFQVRQRADYGVTVLVVPGPSEARAREVAEIVTAELADMFRHAVPVSYEIVGTIPHEGGKARLVVSEVESAGGHPRP